MDYNQLSFTLSMRNNASPALNSLQKQITSLKNGINSLGKGGVATSNFLNSVNSGSRSVKTLTSGVQSLGRSIIRTVGTFGGFKLLNTITNSITGSLDKAIQRADTMDLFSQKIEMITGNAEEASASLEHLKESTKNTPYALDIAAKSVQNFVTRGMETEKATESVDIWMDAVSAYGKGTNEQFESVMDAIGKMRTKGTVEMRYLNRLFAAGINPVRMYAQATGQAAEDVQTALSEKEITSEEFLSVVEDAMRNGTNGVIQVQGMAKKLATTWAAVIANMHIAIARGELELIKGIESVALLFNEDGIKGIIRSYGSWIENTFTKAGKFITDSVTKGKAFITTLREKNSSSYGTANTAVERNRNERNTALSNAKGKFNTQFLKLFGTQINLIYVAFEKVRVIWSIVSDQFAKGLEKVSGLFGSFVGIYLGKAIVGVENLAGAFGKWLELKIPVFFDKLYKFLRFMIDNSDAVANAVGKMIKAFVGFKVLQGIQNTIIGFNDALKGINNTLAFFTGGRVQLPTIESMVLGSPQKQEKKNLRLAQLNEEVRLEQEKIKLAQQYNKERDRLINKRDTAIERIEQNKRRQIGNTNKTYDKKQTKLDETFERDRLRINENKTKKINRLGTDTQKASDSLSKKYESEFNKIQNKKDTKVERIAKAQRSAEISINRTKDTKSNGFSSYTRPLTMSQKEIAEHARVQDDLYRNMLANPKTKSKNPYMNDVFNVHDDYYNAVNDLSGRYAMNKASLDKDYLKKRAKISSDTVDAFTERRAAYNIDTEKLKTSKQTEIQNITREAQVAKYYAKKQDAAKIADLNNKIDVVNAPPPAKKNVISRAWDNYNDWFSNRGWTTPRESFKSVGNGISKVKDKITAPFKKESKVVSTGLELGEDIAEMGVASQKTGIFAKALDKLKGAVVAVKGAFTTAGQGIMSFITSIGGIAFSIVAATAAIGALVAGLGALNPGNSLSNTINHFFDNFRNLCLSFANYAGVMIKNFVTGLKKNLPQLTSQGANLLVSVVSGLLKAIPNMIEAGANLIFSLIDGFLSVLPDLARSGFEAIGQFIGGMIRNLPSILLAGAQMIGSLITGIVKLIPKIFVCGVRLIIEMAKGIISMAGTIATSIGQTIWQAVQWLWQNKGQVWEQVKSFGASIWQALVDGLFELAGSMGSWATKALEAMGLKQTAEQAVTESQQAFNTAAASAQFDWNLVMNKAQADQLPAQASANAAATMSAWNGGLQSSEPVDITSDVNAQMAATAVNSGAYGAETAAGYVNGLSTEESADLGVTTDVAAQMTQTAQEASGLGANTMAGYASGINENSGQVDTALGNVGQQGMAQLNLTFSDTDVATSVTGFVQRIKQALFDSTPLIEDSMRKMATQGISAFINELSTNNEEGLGIPALTQTIVASFASAQTSVSASVTKLRDDVINSFNTLVSTVETALRDIETSIDNLTTKALPSISSTTKTVLGDTLTSFQNFEKDVTNLINGLATYFTTKGAEMVTNLKSGIDSKKSEAVTATSNLVTSLKTTFETGLGIHSPSRFMTWVGQMMLAGLINGMPESQIKKFAAARIESMKNSFKSGHFNADELVDYLGDKSLDVVKYLEVIGDQTLDESNGGGGNVGGVPPIIQEALKYVGYAPGGGNSMMGLYYGNPGAWCASFVRYCAEKVGVPFPATNYVPDVLDWSIATGRYTNTPVPGYAAIFRGGGHIELVAGVDASGNVDMVGGNTGAGEVAHRVRNDATSYVALDGGHSVLTLKDTIMQSYNKKFNPAALITSTGSGQAYNPDAGVEQWRSTVEQALTMLGQPTSLTNDILYAISRESSGDPNAINLTDSNAMAGHPSQGLLQTIPSTFAAYRNPNLPNEITNPLANIYAALNYMIQQYGSVANVVNPRRASSRGWYGYSVGTRYVPEDMPAVIHKGEAIIPANQNPYSQSGGDYLGDLFKSVFENGDLKNLEFKTTSGNNTEETNVYNNNFNVVFNNNISSEADGKRFVGNLESELHKILQNGIRVSTAR